MKILVLSTGGTIDAASFAEDGEPPVYVSATDEHLGQEHCRILQQIQRPILIYITMNYAIKTASL